MITWDSIWAAFKILFTKELLIKHIILSLISGIVSFLILYFSGLQFIADTLVASSMGGAEFKGINFDISSILGVVIGIIISIIIGSILTVAAVYITKDFYNKKLEGNSLGEYISKGVSGFVDFIIYHLISLKYLVIPIFGIIACIYFSIVLENPSLGMIGGGIFGILFLYFAIRLSFMFPFFAEYDNLSLSDRLEKAYQYTEGKWWKTLGALLFITILISLIGMIIGFFFGIIGSIVLASTDSLFVFPLLVTIGSSFLIYTTYMVPYTLYKESEKGLDKTTPQNTSEEKTEV